MDLGHQVFPIQPIVQEFIEPHIRNPIQLQHMQNMVQLVALPIFAQILRAAEPFNRILPPVNQRELEHIEYMERGMVHPDLLCDGLAHSNITIYESVIGPDWRCKYCGVGLPSDQ
ncbi:hypothetical protein QAD02_006220 [Eretmocerus hayati]|uniref:Uncharacterized protein n=1 Tax=Eretmocerus hayati TaxID=131215 RepID=A0ACC2N0R2_9HYME|nr:hypothetical protein QAD02_006220 [Eretmocerus hayati]